MCASWDLYRQNSAVWHNSARSERERVAFAFILDIDQKCFNKNGMNRTQFVVTVLITCELATVDGMLLGHKRLERFCDHLL